MLSGACAALRRDREFYIVATGQRQHEQGKMQDEIHLMTDSESLTRMQFAKLCYLSIFDLPSERDDSLRGRAVVFANVCKRARGVHKRHERTNAKVAVSRTSAACSGALECTWLPHITNSTHNSEITSTPPGACAQVAGTRGACRFASSRL